MKLILQLILFFSYIKKQDWFEESTIILTADHGHTFMPRNNSFALDEIRIPLFVKTPFKIKTKIENSFIEGSVDLMPSILHIAGVDIPQKIDGKIWPFLGGEVRDKIFSESLYHPNYEAKLIDKKYFYQFRCPYDKLTGKISFEQKDPVKIFNYSGNSYENNDISSAHPDLVDNFTNFVFNHVTRE